MAFDKVTYQRDLMRKRRGTKVPRTPVSKRPGYKTLHNANSYRARTSSHDATPFKISFSPGGMKATYASNSSEYNLRLRKSDWDNDQKIVAEVLKRKCYKKVLAGNSKVWLDAGGHLGSFAIFALADGKSDHVYCYEAFPESCDLLRMNTVGLPVTVNSKAVNHDGSPLGVHLTHTKSDGAPLMFRANLPPHPPAPEGILGISPKIPG